MGPNSILKITHDWRSFAPLWSTWEMIPLLGVMFICKPISPITTTISSCIFELHNLANSTIETNISAILNKFLTFHSSSPRHGNTMSKYYPRTGHYQLRIIKLSLFIFICNNTASGTTIITRILNRPLLLLLVIRESDAPFVTLFTSLCTCGTVKRCLPVRQTTPATKRANK